jgi:arsenite methyltransferase
MGLRGALDAQFARQLGHPSGLAGRVMARGLNRGNARLITAAVDALEPSRRTSLADVGFGGGLGLRLLLTGGPDPTVHGIEVSTAMLQRAETTFSEALASGRLLLHQAPVERLPLSDSSLDGAITVNTLYFVADLDRAFAELARVLNGSGRVVIGIGDPDAMKALRVTAHGFRLRPVDEITAALIAAGLPITHHHRVDTGRIPAHILTAEPDR